MYTSSFGTCLLPRLNWVMITVTVVFYSLWLRSFKRRLPTGPSSISFECQLACKRKIWPPVLYYICCGSQKNVAVVFKYPSGYVSIDKWQEPRPSCEWYRKFFLLMLVLITLDIPIETNFVNYYLSLRHWFWSSVELYIASEQN